MSISDILFEVHQEYNRASQKFGAFASAHEGWAVLLEEYEELDDEAHGLDRTINDELDYLRDTLDYSEITMDIANRIRKRLWNEIKGSQRIEKMRHEAIQIAAMAVRFVHDICEFPYIESKK